MSAPWEVWHDTWTSKRGGELVRYLRADLTCGECARGNNDAKPFCERWTFFSDPACMEFQPKEEVK